MTIDPISFQPVISLNGLLITAGTLISAVFAWRDLNWRQKNIENWRVDHMEYSRRQEQLLEEVRKLVTGQEARLLLIEKILERESRRPSR
jgi:hypothetical protein